MAFEKLLDYFFLRLNLWLLDSIDDEVLETGNAVFANGKFFPRALSSTVWQVVYVSLLRIVYLV